MNYDTCIIGAKDTTLKLVSHLLDLGHSVDLIITVEAFGDIDTSKIAGYQNFREFACANSIELFEVSEYAMNDSRTKAFFSNNTFGIAICMGWQRLIPKPILDCFNHGVFGFHGSCGYLPYGRGRSPLNWSIIIGDTRFILNMFKYDEHADSPNIFQQRQFEITPFDTIRTLQYKNLITAFEMADQLLHACRFGSIDISLATHDPDSFYPKRTPDDGKIDFGMKTRDIYNLIRGTTRPFPGAFCFDSETGERVTIWRAVPFDQVLDFSQYAPGEIIDVFDCNIVLRTIDGSLIIYEYETDAVLSKGCMLR